MIGLDTNVVVRHLVHDDPNQSKAATRAFAGLTPGEPGLLTTVVLIETYWAVSYTHLDVYKRQVGERRLVVTGPAYRSAGSPTTVRGGSGPTDGA